MIVHKGIRIAVVPAMEEGYSVRATRPQASDRGHCVASSGSTPVYTSVEAFSSKLQHKLAYDLADMQCLVGHCTATIANTM